MTQPFARAIATAPIPDNAARADKAAEAVSGASPEVTRLIEGVAGCSPYLARLIEKQADFLKAALDRPADETMATILAETEAAHEAPTQDALMKTLRIQKARAALFIALCDCGGVWPLETTLRALSDFADASAAAAAEWLLRDAAHRNLLPLDPNDPVGSSGLAILALGKMGAHELNYSSDIDVVLFFDPERHEPDAYPKLKKGFNQLTRGFVKILSEQTADGYVHRVDLRLRPDPGSTAACLGMDAAERYYESMGKNWERAAYIKARAVGGDITAGEAFIEGMTPFVWRRYLDFATIEDVRDMKRLIHKHKGHGEITVPGHDLKLGRGGIREIEFFAQTQQLIAGGREKKLRLRGTLDALAALAEHGWIREQARDEMGESYRYLRTLEHRVQMVDDAQTHKLPDEDGLPRIAAFMGYETVEAMETELRGHLERVAERFARLFEGEEDEDDKPEISLVSPEAGGQIESILIDMGFNDAPASAKLLARWGGSDMNATKSPRARAKLERLAPKILEAAASASDPDRALAAFDKFLSGLPAGVQIFSLFEANPNLLDLLTGICAAAPRLAEYLGRNSGVIDAMLARDFFERTPGVEDLLAELNAALPGDDDFEEVLNASRRWSKERHFRIGAQLLRGIASPEEAGRAYSVLAEACLRGLAPRVTAELAKRHGPPPGKGACVLAMGRLGSREMTASSDLDLLVIYDADGAEQSEGRSPLAPQQYYARWTQRLVAAMTAPTAEGALFEVDMRLRPSGQSGPLATRLESFRRYQAEQAWTWEHMALSRGRIVVGPDELIAETRSAIQTVLIAPRDEAETLQNARDMRQRLIDADPKAFEDGWNVKRARGGLVDIDFVIQTQLLLSGCATVETAEPGTALDRLLAEGALSTEDHDALMNARRCQATILQFARLALDGGLSRENASPALGSAIAQALGIGDFAAVETRLSEVQEAARAVYEARMGV